MLLALLLLSLSCRNARGYNPKPNAKSVVEVGGARFTVLTERLVRMEWGHTNDEATFAFLNRDLPTPNYDVGKEGNTTVIQTPFLKVRYTPTGHTFTAANLEASVQLNGETVTWAPEPAATAGLRGNLLGTIRTLDGVNGTINLDCYTQNRSDLHCQLGLVSRDGFVVVDDTHHPHFNEEDWPWVVNTTYPQPSPLDCAAVSMEQRMDCGYPGISEFDCKNKGCCMDSSAERVGEVTTCYYGHTSYRDLYFFGHGHDYRAALREFTLVSGKIPIPPRYAFGIFYSRYWAYNDIGDRDVVLGYESRNIPLDTLVMDMDWHKTFYKEAAEGMIDQAGESIGWTGFTWDEHLFPDPQAFLDWCKSKGLQNTLNIHPASGIQPWEDTYSVMASAMGIDPQSEEYVPFVPSDPKFVVNWLTKVMGRREAEGIDFWWLDWQQGEEWIKIPLVNPTFWLNYVFFTTPYHWKNNTVSHLATVVMCHHSSPCRCGPSCCTAGEGWATIATRLASLETSTQAGHHCTFKSTSL
jgi:alpha-glucosidase